MGSYNIGCERRKVTLLVAVVILAGKAGMKLMIDKKKERTIIV